MKCLFYTCHSAFNTNRDRTVCPKLHIFSFKINDVACTFCALDVSISLFFATASVVFGAVCLCVYSASAPNADRWKTVANINIRTMEALVLNFPKWKVKARKKRFCCFVRFYFAVPYNVFAVCPKSKEHFLFSHY